MKSFELLVHVVENAVNGHSGVRKQCDLVRIVERTVLWAGKFELL